LETLEQSEGSRFSRDEHGAPEIVRVVPQLIAFILRQAVPVKIPQEALGVHLLELLLPLSKSLELVRLLVGLRGIRVLKRLFEGDFSDLPLLS